MPVFASTVVCERQMCDCCGQGKAVRDSDWQIVDTDRCHDLLMVAELDLQCGSSNLGHTKYTSSSNKRSRKKGMGTSCRNSGMRMDEFEEIWRVNIDFQGGGGGTQQLEATLSSFG